MLTTTMTNEDKLWDTKLRNIQWSLNSMVSSTNGRTPMQLLYSFTPRDILQNKLTLALHENVAKTEEELRVEREQAAKRMNAKRAKAKARYDNAHQRPEHYSLGDLVLVENEPTSTGHSRKLEPRYKGPFVITKDLGRDRYVVEDLPRSGRSKRHYVSVYSSDRMKKWCQLPEDDDDSDDEIYHDDGCHNDDEDVCTSRMAEL